MKIKLYTNVYEDAFEKKLIYYDLEINGKIIMYTDVLEDVEGCPRCVFEQRQFTYSYDDSFITIFSNLKLNTKIKIEPYLIEGYTDNYGCGYQDDADIARLEGYCHLNFLQRLILNYRFKKLWIQKEENLKWTVGLAVSIATAVGGTGLFFV